MLSDYHDIPAYMPSKKLAASAIASAATTTSPRAIRPTLSFQVIPNSPLGITNYYQNRCRVCTAPVEIEYSHTANNR